MSAFGGRFAMLRIAPRLLGQRLQEFLHGLAELLGEPGDLLVGGAVLQRLAERLLRVAERLRGERQVAVLDAEGDAPEIVDDARGARRRSARSMQAVIGAAERQIVAEIVDACSRARRSARRARRRPAGAALASSASLARCSTTARASGSVKRRGGERQLDRLAPALLLGLVAGDQRHQHLGAGPRDGRSGRGSSRRCRRGCGAAAATAASGGAAKSGRAAPLGRLHRRAARSRPGAETTP